MVLSKQLFDMFVLTQDAKPSHWMGLKFFNVYGPHETHKGRMASVIFHAFHQVKATGALKLFQSHHKDCKDGEQLRDFVFVDDVVAVCLYFYNVINTQKATVSLNGIYNLGTGLARTFNDLG
jgi:ADP-L-glycero-D-manno-heptose 6-epimerase